MGTNRGKASEVLKHTKAKNVPVSMSFIGTQQKCKACEKTVYMVDQLFVDGVAYHKACLKCSHCKGTLKVISAGCFRYFRSCICEIYFYFQLSNYSSMEGVLYRKPHFEQLFKETSSYHKSFQSHRSSHSC
ncbi:hypothetical protein HHK36_027219 [Tetracentron sinense]|uniref:LIM zinc-binding domain-containing protein n=1 Tax=Tetracentron sinense TaxID=13715 RepID=A0A834YGG1_TETSI|nr:hypothetical protein HHK36_027219 [Tetracentron sinense]